MDEVEIASSLKSKLLGAQVLVAILHGDIRAIDVETGFLDQRQVAPPAGSRSIRW